MKTLFTFLFILIVGVLFAQQNISNARNSLGQTVTVSGIVTNGSEFGIIRYIQDNTAGIAAYGDKISNVKRGDSITISGTVKAYNNLLEIDPINSVTVHSSGNSLPKPKIISIDEIGEDYEGQLIQINKVKITNTNGTFSGSKNYEFSENGRTGELRINSNSSIVGEVIPTDEFNLLAICSQYSFSTNDTRSGYQLLPRDMNDLISVSAINILTPLEISTILTNNITLNWKTDITSSSQIRYGNLREVETLTQIVSGNSVEINGKFQHEVQINGLSPAAIIYAQAFSVSGNDTAFSAIGAFATQSNSSGEIKVYFNTPVDETQSTGILAQNIDNAMEDTLINYINRAEETIDLCIYNFNNSGLSDVSAALNNAAIRGVRIRFITSGSTAHSGVNDLNNNIPVVESPFGSDDGIMHNKFAIFDAHSENANKPWVWTGSLNISYDQVNTDAQNILFIQDQTLAKVYEIEFEEMWGSDNNTPNLAKSKFGASKTDNTPHELFIGGNFVESYFSPSDNTNQKIIDAIKTAENDLQVETMVITRTDIALAIKEMYEKGVDVQMLTNYSNDNSETVNNILNETLPNGKYISDNAVNGILHHKLAIVDANFAASDPQVITGSHNWSNSANERNDENTLIIHNAEIANQYFQQFAYRFGENGGSLHVSASSLNEIDINVYPNPFSEKINIISAIPIKEIKVFSVEGEIIYVRNKNISLKSTIDLLDLDEGLYILHLKNANGEVSYFKVIKVKQ